MTSTPTGRHPADRRTAPDASGAVEQCPRAARPGVQHRDGAERPTVNCPHPGRPHRHGTRVAYVKDRCRCRACTAANTTRSHEIARAKAMGRWRPYIDISPVRAHLADLRAAHVGYRQIARTAGTSTGHIREIAATSTRSGGRPPSARIRATLAARILAIRPGSLSPSPNATVPALGTRRRIQALVAIGWPLAELAARLRRDISSLESILGATLVAVRTARAVEQLYDTIWDQHPAATTPEQCNAVTSARQRAAEADWAPPLAWDDIDTDQRPAPDGCPDRDYIDQVAVERAVQGDAIRLSNLTPAEQAEAVRRLTELGLSARAIATRLATTERTIARRRATTQPAASATECHRPTAPPRPPLIMTATRLPR